jgi:hypothetical protein
MTRWSGWNQFHWIGEHPPDLIRCKRAITGFQTTSAHERGEVLLYSR